MLQITIKGQEFYDETKQEFIYLNDTTITLEHSLVSISKWESKWKKPFLSSGSFPKTNEEIIDYIRCMTITQNVDPKIYFLLSQENIKEITDYIDDPMTATTITDMSNSSKGETLTSELLYYYMFSAGIPKEIEKWHLNRLITLIRIFAIKNNPKKKKMSKREISNRYRDLNAQRRNALNSNG